MTNRDSFEEWLIAQVISRPEKLFILWAISESRCTRLDDFQEYFEDELPVDTLVKKLEIQGFITQIERDLALTDLGKRAVSSLGSDQHDTRVRVLEETIEIHRSGLALHSRMADPDAWAATQVNLGRVLSQRAEIAGEEDRVAFLNDAVSAYRAALEIYERETGSNSWIVAQNGLSSAKSAQVTLAESITPFPRVFISHSRHDNAFTRTLVKDLDNHGVYAWVDIIDPKPGDFMQTINHALDNSDWLIVVLSAYALRSGAVITEVNAALNRVWQKRMRGVIPVVAEPIDAKTIPAMWATLQRFDASTDYDTAFGDLLKSIEVAV